MEAGMFSYHFLLPSSKYSQLRRNAQYVAYACREGAYVQRSKTSCFLAFYTICAHKHRLLMLMKASGETELATLACYCEKHLPVSIDQCPIAYAPYLNATRKSNTPHMKSPSLSFGSLTPTHPSYSTIRPVLQKGHACIQKRPQFRIPI